MKIIKNKILNWEPLEIRFIPKKKKKGWDKEVFEWLHGWEKDRLEIAGDLQTSQIPLEYYIAKVTSNGTVAVHVEWLCEKSIEIFANYIRKNGTNINQLIIGDEIGETLSTEQIELKIHFIKVPEKLIYTETQTNIRVPSFEISKYPITVGQYKKFTNATDYKTTNERKGCYLTYFNNDFLIGMSLKEKESTAASCISYNDAIEYCKWAGVRLPSDHEWLSAAVLDWKIEYKDDDITEELIQKNISKPLALQRLSSEWIGEYITKSDSAYVREGPVYLLEKGWKKPKQRKKYPTKYTDLLLQFRVCKV
jgi:hypothetical protein